MEYLEELIFDTGRKVAVVQASNPYAITCHAHAYVAIIAEKIMWYTTYIALLLH